MKRLAVFALSLALLAGCAARVTHPGAVNQFDSNAYDVVLITHGVIEDTKTDLAANAFPASIAGNVKTALNDLIKAYNVADTSYKAYHNAAVAGNPTAAQIADVQGALQDITTKTTALAAAKGSK